MLARLFAVRSLLLSPVTIGIVVIGIMLICTLLPHAPITVPPLIYYLSLLGNGLCVSLALVAFLLGQRVIRQLTPLYRPAITWLIRAILLHGLVALAYLVIRLIWIDHLNPDIPKLVVLASGALFSVNGVVFLLAGYNIDKASRR